MATESMGDKVFVALPDSYDEGMSVLSWVLTHFPSDKTEIIITHIITSPFKGLFDRPTERENMELVLSMYLSQCSAQKFKAEKLVHVSDNIAEGLAHLIAQNGIKNLVMRAAPNSEMNGIVSETGRKVTTEANSSCKIWFLNDGDLIFTREANTYWLTKPSEQLNQASSSTSASTSSRSNPNSPSQARDLVVVDTSLKEMLNEASVEAVNFHMIANEELIRREQVEKEMFGAYKKSMLLLTKVTEALLSKEQHMRDIEAILERERLEKDVLKREIQELKQAKGQQGEIERLQRENDQLRSRQDENLNLIHAANEKKLSLERQISNLELIVKDLQTVSASIGDCLDSLQFDYNKLLQEKEDVLKELRRQREDAPSGSGSSSNSSSEFLLQELEQATRNFSALLKIGEGGFGWVYKGSLRGTTVAIKMLRSQNLQSIAQFQQEVTILTKVRHPNLVTLMGACSEASALIYEYLSNGSLEDRLRCANNTPPLTWQVRTRIIGEICLALIFLHANKPHLVVHGDLKPENILLDANLVSKLSDFGIAKLLKQHNPNMTAFYQTSNPSGTFAYTDPEFLATGMLTSKSDVYSFGIIVLRLLTGKSPLNIVRQVEDTMRSGVFQNVIDESAGRWPLEEAEILAEVGLRCADLDRKRRPDMVSDVWAVVEPLMKAASEVATFGADVDEQVPSQFICPIYQEIMKNPHIAADGFTYEGEAIMHWLNTHNTSPMTNLVLSHQNVIQNINLRSAIQDWLQEHPQT